MAMEYWSPKGEGTGFELSPILEPLAPFRDQMLVLSGLNASWNYIHAGASGSFLTGTTRGGRNEVEIIADVSMDQLLARKFAQRNAGGVARALDGWSGQRRRVHGQPELRYTHTLSWRSPTQPLPMEYNPRAVFERLFGDSGTTERDGAGNSAASAQEHSGLCLEKLIGLKKELGPRDQIEVDEYTESVRDVERRIQKAEEQHDLELPDIEQPQGVPPVFEDHLTLMLDLQLLAFQSDLTRVITFMIGKEQSARPYPQIGVPEAHHPLSHHDDVPDLIAAHVEDQPLSHGAFLEVPGQTRRHAGRRRLAPGSRDDPLRFGYFQQHAPFRRQLAVDAGGRRGRNILVLLSGTIRN